MSLVTDAVHAKGGLIVNQIWHTGRFSHSSLQPDGKAPFAPSAIPIKGEHKTREGELVPYETPRDRGSDRRHRLGLRAGCRQLEGGWLRWRGDPRRERISDRSIPAQWQQPAHRPLWRPGREPRA